LASRSLTKLVAGVSMNSVAPQDTRMRTGMKMRNT